MKKIVLTLTAVLAVAAGLHALDQGKVEGWENRLSAAMSQMDEGQLKKKEADLTTALGQKPADPGLLTEKGIVEHNLSLVNKRVKGHASQAVEALTQALDRQLEEELRVFAVAYLGSALSLQASEETDTGKKIDLVNKGFARLDEGVARYGSASFVPRYLRANVSLSVPEFLKKLETADEDLKSLRALVQAQPQRVPTEIQASIALLSGNCQKKLKHLDQAVAYWKKARDLDPQKIGAGKEAARNLELYAE